MNQKELNHYWLTKSSNVFKIRKIINNHLAYEFSLIPDYKVINITYGKDYLNKDNVFKMRKF